MPDQWMVIVAGPTLVEELRRLPDDTSSFYDAAEDVGPTWLALASY